MTNEERMTLQSFLMHLLEENEPRAMLGSLRRLVEYRALIGSHGGYNRKETLRWITLSRLLVEAEKELKNEMVSD